MRIDLERFLALTFALASVGVAGCATASPTSSPTAPSPADPPAQDPTTTPPTSATPATGGTPTRNSAAPARRGRTRPDPSGPDNETGGPTAEVPRWE